MVGPGSPRHQRLKEAAFGRDGTAADLAALAAYEASLRDAPSDDPVEAPLEQVAPTQAPATPRAYRRRVFVALLGLAVACGAGLGWLAHWTVDLAARVSSLDVFQRPAAEADSSDAFEMMFQNPSRPGAVAMTDTRLLNSIDGRTFYAALGIMNVGETAEAPTWVSTVCLVATQTSSSMGSCMRRDEFLRDGMAFEGEGFSYRWGPTGDVQAGPRP